MILHKNKAKWVKQFKPNIIKGEILHNPAGVGDRYSTELKKLVGKMRGITEKKISSLYKTSTAKEHFTGDASISSQARILTNALTKQFDDLFSISAKPLSEAMVEQADKSSQVALKTSVKKINGNLNIDTTKNTKELHDIKKSIVAENVALIKSIAKDYMHRVTTEVLRSITTGKGLQDLYPKIKEFGDMTDRRAHNIATDQTRKAYNHINAKRAKGAGIEAFEWVHSGGGLHPREEHIAMDGQIFQYDDLPVIDENTGETGLPGQAINCRCTQRPVVVFE